MRRYTLFHAFYMAFYSKSLYRDVMGHWRGAGILYLLVLLSLSTIPGVLRLASIFSDIVASDAPAIVRQIPALTIAGGRLSADVEQPYFIMDKDSSVPLVIIDTTGAHKNLEGTPARMLFTETQILVRRDGTHPLVWELAEFGDLKIDRRIAFDALESLQEAFPLLLYPFALLFSLAVHAALALLLGLAAYGSARLSGARPDLQMMLRLAAVALTPSIILGTVLAAVGGRPPFWWAAGVIISAGYMLYGLRARDGSEDLDTDAGRRL